MVLNVAFSADNRLVRAADRDGTVYAYDIETGRRVQTLVSKDQPRRADDYSAVAFAPNDKLIARADTDEKISILDLETGKLVTTISEHQNSHVLTFSPNSQVLATMGYSGQREQGTGSRYRSVRFWDVKTGKLLGQSDGNQPLSVMAFTPDGKELITDGSSKGLLIWNVSSLIPQ